MSCLRIFCRFSFVRLASCIAAAVCSLAIVASRVGASAHPVVADDACGGEVACADGNGGCGRCWWTAEGCGRGGCAAVGCHGDGTHCGMPAPSYPVPFATPKNVTHTTFTYPPMMPHHSLPHYAGTYSFRHGPGLSRTNVHWRPTTGINSLRYLKHMFEIPR